MLMRGPHARHTYSRAGQDSKEQMLIACALCYFNIEFLYIYVTSLRGQKLSQATPAPLQPNCASSYVLSLPEQE